MTTNQAPERDEVEDLLPWHAAGTLGRRDAERVEEALARDPELARRYALVREELAADIHLNETLGAPSTRAAERLFAAIEAEGRPARRSLNLAARIGEFFASLTPRQLAYSAAAAAVAIVLQAGLIGAIIIGERGQATYETASTGQAPSTAGTFALVRFAPQATAAAVTKFLDDNKATIVGGPSAGGLYRLRIAATPLPAAERDRIIARMQAASSVVGFVAATQ